MLGSKKKVVSELIDIYDGLVLVCAEGPASWHITLQLCAGSLSLISSSPAQSGTR